MSEVLAELSPEGQMGQLEKEEDQEVVLPVVGLEVVCREEGTTWLAWCAMNKQGAGVEKIQPNLSYLEHILSPYPQDKNTEVVLPPFRDRKFGAGWLSVWLKVTKQV